jgi:hypothetical protein
MENLNLREDVNTGLIRLEKAGGEGFPSKSI